MKTILLAAACLLFTIISLNAQPRYKLNEAISKGFIKLKISGTGMHTGKCANIQAENNTTQEMDVIIDCGQKIQCSDSNAQNLVITQTEKIHLSPKKTIMMAVYAMCINAGKGSPADKVGFRLGKMAQGALLRLTQFIEKKKYQNSSAQSAVWTITDNRDIASIGFETDDNYEMNNELRGFVATEKHITNYPKSKPQTRAEKTVEGSFDIFLQNPTNVEVVLVDHSNKTVKLYNKGMKQAGILRINYSVKNTDFKQGNYYIVVRSGNKELKRELVVVE